MGDGRPAANRRLAAGGAPAATDAASFAAQALGLRAPQQIQRAAGKVLQAPRVVLVAAGAGTDVATLQTFLQRWRDSASWPLMTAEYGIGQLEVAPVQQLAQTLPSPLCDAGDEAGEAEASPLEAAVAALAAGDGEAGRTVYVVVLPPNSVASPVRRTADACAAHIWAWHSAAEVPVQASAAAADDDDDDAAVGARTAAGPRAALGSEPEPESGTATKAGTEEVAYVVLPDCSGTNVGSASVLARDRRTAALSHALLHAITNPTLQGIAGSDAAHVAGEVLAEDGELGTLCTQALHGSSNWWVRPDDLGFAVARIWSNAASAAGTMPCVPAAATEAHFTADAALPDEVTAQLAGGTRTVNTPGVALAAGSGKEIALQLLAAAGDTGPLQLQVEEVGSHDLTLTLARNHGQAGEAVALHVALRKRPAHDQQVVRVTALRGTLAYSHYFLVQRQEST